VQFHRRFRLAELRPREQGERHRSMVVESKA
jgi:hypothetical protein